MVADDQFCKECKEVTEHVYFKKVGKYRTYIKKCIPCETREEVGMDQVPI